MTITSGMLISIEGIDGSGKSTLVRHLAKQLQIYGCSVVTTKEPGGSSLGKLLREILQHQPVALMSRAEYLLFAADRAQHMDEVIKPALKSGAVVISDRMADSSLAYQGYGRGEDLAMINTINVWAMQESKPDLTFYMKIEPEEAIKRLKKRTTLTAFEKEQTGFVKRLIKGFDEIFRDRDNVITLDGTLPPKEIAENATQAVMQWATARELQAKQGEIHGGR